MDNDYVKMAKYPYNKKRFETYKGHIDSCRIIWSREDVFGIAHNIDEKLTNDEADQVLYLLVQKHNPEYGCNWDTIRGHIDDIVRERE